ncbi:MAG TPA: DNA translocase FtsK 4TM domain-containing protein [Candidatus Kapabacteria bacterium]|nr:DNA translocase FtsK 4TM domain-containing protein [Candidatus Kapabacteria bacterium]
MSRRRQSSFDPTLSKAIIALLLLVLTIIIILSFIGKAGTVGVILDDYILSFLFGSMRYASPVFLLIMAWFLIRDVDYDYRRTHAIGAILFFLATASLFHLGFEPDAMWHEALEGHGGGAFGMLAWPLKTYLGSIASVVLLIGLVFVSVLLTFNTAITAFVLLHKKMFAGFGALGLALIKAIKFLFVKNETSTDVKINNDYQDTEAEEETEESDEEAEESEEESEEAPRPVFKKRTLGQAAEEEETDAEAEESPMEETGMEAAKKPANPWASTVIIKNLPPVNILHTNKTKPTSGDIKSNAQVIGDTLKEFNIDVEMGEIRVGPTVTQYSLKPSKGVKLTRITSLSNDLALALAAHPIRIEAPIPGKSLVGIEVPNQKTAMVTFRELVESKEFATRSHNMTIALGKDVAGKVWFADLPRMPHLLIAGSTGSGKTVCVNTIIMSLLYQNTAETLRMIMVDPKRVELTMYNGIPHLLTPVITNTQKTVNSLKWAIGEMERRFEVLAAAGSRDIGSYNAKNPNDKLPYIVFIIDELADLMATAANDVEAGIIRLAQMARAVGIHLIVATQRPSVDVITGLMKANIPARIAFSVASLIDSRTILDSPGAEKLLGRGDMLFQTAELGKSVRIQGAFISEEELKAVVEYLKGDETPVYDESIVEKQSGSGNGTVNMFGGPGDDHDPLFEEAKQAILDAGKASASFLQRRFKVGYARAARILDELEAAGIIGPGEGAKPREILVTEREVPATMGAGQEHTVFDDPETSEEASEKNENPS